jgi:hypothetical protein
MSETYLRIAIASVSFGAGALAYKWYRESRIITWVGKDKDGKEFLQVTPVWGNQSETRIRFVDTFPGGLIFDIKDDILKWDEARIEVRRLDWWLFHQNQMFGEAMRETGRLRETAKDLELQIQVMERRLKQLNQSGQ